VSAKTGGPRRAEARPRPFNLGLFITNRLFLWTPGAGGFCLESPRKAGSFAHVRLR